MTVIVLTAVPQSLRGQLTRWLLEVSAGVFVGKVSARVRELLWARVKEHIGTGRALMVWQARTEQGLDFLTHNHDWQPTDFEGVTLMLRPRKDESSSPSQASGWSATTQRRRYGQKPT
ncbi:type I-E CRISPR-associated endoribonuclease Cas2e [Jonesia quinghaiensis]|uniref:type I-E CRISPR-associated endoribonuclease Cas2e n=1 Tax=Jonesia quinghaiensis TaxID=262806 RepID=UPI00041A8152|nr:type I-E CRISPR-associated endoribonuclease Cas2e [Jonesia quinghaiensis]